MPLRKSEQADHGDCRKRHPGDGRHHCGRVSLPPMPVSATAFGSPSTRATVGQNPGGALSHRHRHLGVSGVAGVDRVFGEEMVGRKIKSGRRGVSTCSRLSIVWSGHLLSCHLNLFVIWCLFLVFGIILSGWASPETKPTLPVVIVMYQRFKYRASGDNG